MKQENEPNIHQPSLKALNDWRNVPDLGFSVNQAIRQQLVNTKTYQKAKLKYQIANITCKMCNVEQETIPHNMCGCSSIAQGIYKGRHDKMLRPLHHFTLDKYGFEESEVNKPWYQQSLPQPVMENQKQKFIGISIIMLPIAHRTTINQTLLFLTKKITSGLSSRDSVQYWKNPRKRTV